MSDRFTLHLGDCLEAMRTMPDNSVDACVTDPPYGLSDHRPQDVTDCLTAWLKGEEYRPNKRGFMGRTWDSWVPGPEVWREAMRVLKPGGHILAFSGSRTMDLMSMAIRLAGFEIRDTVAWCYSQGFPKSMDVSKKIDQMAGAEREVIGRATGGCGNTDASMHKAEGFAASRSAEYDITAPATDAARQWSGWGTSLKPAFEPCIMARKPLIGTVAENVLRHGTGAINIDGCRIAFAGEADEQESKSKNQHATFGSAPPSSDVYQYGLGGRGNYDPPGRFPANLILDGSPEVLAVFPDSAGSGGSVPNTRVAGYGAVQEYHGGERQKHDAGSGSAARFFYCAKASRKDRNEGLTSGRDPAVGTGATMREREDADWKNRNGNHHPTVKPTDLMRYLCRLITPPGGTVLDPFTGSGSTGKAAMLEGFRFIGCEMDPEYWLIAHARIDAAAKSCNADDASTTEEE